MVACDRMIGCLDGGTMIGWSDDGRTFVAREVAREVQVRNPIIVRSGPNHRPSSDHPTIVRSGPSAECGVQSVE